MSNHSPTYEDQQNKLRGMTQHGTKFDHKRLAIGRARSHFWGHARVHRNVCYHVMGRRGTVRNQLVTRARPPSASTTMSLHRSDHEQAPLPKCRATPIIGNAMLYPSKRDLCRDSSPTPARCGGRRLLHWGSERPLRKSAGQTIKRCAKAISEEMGRVQGR